MKKILILASNPRRDLALDQEIRDLKGAIEQSRDREQLQVEIGLATRSSDLQQALLHYEPQIVHFCGHGTGEQGLVLEDNQGRERLVSTEALSGLFELFPEQVECVLLNSCYSEVQADAIVQHINYVIGMSQEIRDDAAIGFAKGFYRALGYGRSIDQAYKFGCNEIQIALSQSLTARSNEPDPTRKLGAADTTPTIIPEHLKPILKKKAVLTIGNFSQPNKEPIPPNPTREPRKQIEQRGKYNINIDKADNLRIGDNY